MRLSKLGNPTFLTLNMLAQCTERCEACSTRVHRAHIHLVLMPRAREVLVQTLQGAIGVVAEVALVHRTVPGGFGGKVLVHDILGTFAASEQTRRIGDDVARVEAADFAVDGGTVHARAARARFEVKDEGGDGDKGQTTAFERAADVLGCMRGGVHVLYRPMRLRSNVQSEG